MLPRKNTDEVIGIRPKKTKKPLNTSKTVLLRCPRPAKDTTTSSSKRQSSATATATENSPSEATAKPSTLAASLRKRSSITLSAIITLRPKATRSTLD